MGRDARCGVAGGGPVDPADAADGTPFPQHGVLLVVTFVVILVTLAGQGLTLPWVVRQLHIENVDHHVPDAEQELALKAELAGVVMTHLAAHPSADAARYDEVVRQVESGLDMEGARLDG